MLEPTKLEEDEPAVQVWRACKSYGFKGDRQIILDNLNMLVPKGSIYGLLGASGCGKTTLLNCIIGRKKIQSGEIWALGGQPGSRGSGIPGPRVGYMPQEVGLYGEFTIWETMKYFGWIANMSIHEIYKRADFLIELLELPDRNKFIKELSGGQQRRVSLAATFIHNPELLILDEPTVGLDPLLREKIWNHLEDLTSTKRVTVIITTHYIDETKQATLIGMMRKGKLLAEQSPKDLMRNYGLNSLEDIFLQLSQQQNLNLETIQINNALPANEPPEPVFNEFKKSAKDDKFNILKYLAFSIQNNHLKALIWKNLIWMWRNFGVMAFIFILPLLEQFIYCLSIGRDPEGLHIAIINNEVPYPHNVPCTFNSSCNLERLSCRYLHHLSKSKHELVSYQDFDSAFYAVKKGYAWGVITIPEEFSINMAERAELGRFANDSALDNSEIDVNLDMSNQHIALLLRKDILLALKALSEDVADACGLSRSAIALPIKSEKPVYGSEELSFTNYGAPGTIITIIFFLAVTLTTDSILYERNEGIMERGLVSGITSIEIIAGHTITQCVVLIFESAVLILLTFNVLGIENHGSLFSIYIHLVITGFCGVSYGLVISCLCDEERTAMYLALGSFLPFIELCGIFWPIEGMHGSLKPIANFLPLTMPTNSLRAMMARGWGLSYSTVYLGFLSNIVWTFLLFFVSMILIKYKK